MDIKDLEEPTKSGFNLNAEILENLSKGLTINEISENLQNKGIKPNSLSIIDKRIKLMKKKLDCSTLYQLMYKIGKQGIL